MRILPRIFPLLLLLLLFVPLSTASAHEVYVLDEKTIAEAFAAESPNPFSAFHGNEYEFFFWGFISFIVFSTILFASVFHIFEKYARGPLLFLKRAALPLVRLTVAVTLIVFGSYGVLYGPELPLHMIFGGANGWIEIVLMLLGAAILLGVFARTAALGAITLYLYALGTEGLPLLNYLTHLGAYLTLILLGSGEWSLGAKWNVLRSSSIEKTLHRLRPLAFPLLRMGFGFSVMFAAVYAKFLHSELTLQVVYHYELTQHLPFEPLFIVLGALIIEFLAGLMMFLGIAVRWTALFLAFWMTMGHIFTEEMWWVHLILYGIALAIFCHGYDKWSLGGRFLQRDGRDPVL